MKLLDNLIIDIYSIALLIIICLQSLKHDEKKSLQYKLYMEMVLMTILMLIMDIFSRFDGRPNSIYFFINHIGNFLVFFLNLILPSLWLLYVHFIVFQNEGKTRRLFYPLFFINIINAVMVVLSQFFGWFYYIDSENIYHRGPIFLLPVAITIALMLMSIMIIIVNRKNIDHKYFFALVFFPVPPFISICLQISFYGISIMFNSVVISLLIEFLDIQNHSIYNDYLTGVNNRKKLEIYLKDKIGKVAKDKTFSAIMIDLNDFKSINDTFGHDMGDNALQESAKLLRSCLRSNDFISRYGGDEFFIVLDVSNMDDLEEIIDRINSSLDKYNESSDQPYKLGFSMGYAVYDFHSHLQLEEFQKHIDMLMYQNKQTFKKEMQLYDRS